MGFEVLHGIVDCLWVGEPISTLKEVYTYDWIAFLPMSDGLGAYSRYLAG